MEFKQAYDPIEVEYDDKHTYVTVDLTRSQKKKVGEKQIALLMADDDDELIELWGEFFDLILAPVGDNKTKLSTLLKKDWKADKLEIDMPDAFMDRLTAERKARRADSVKEILTDRPS